MCVLHVRAMSSVCVILDWIYGFYRSFKFFSIMSHHIHVQNVCFGCENILISYSLYDLLKIKKNVYIFATKITSNKTTTKKWHTREGNEKPIMEIDIINLQFSLYIIRYKYLCILWICFFLKVVDWDWSQRSKCRRSIV